MKGGDIMCCHTERHRGVHSWHRPHFCDCGCDEPPFMRPRFLTRKQRIEALEQRLAELREEVNGVEAHIAQIKKEK